MSRRSRLRGDLGGPHDYGPKGSQNVLFYGGILVVFVVLGAGMRDGNVLVIAIGVVLALALAAKVKDWYTPRS